MDMGCCFEIWQTVTSEVHDHGVTRWGAGRPGAGEALGVLHLDRQASGTGLRGTLREALANEPSRISYTRWTLRLWDLAPPRLCTLPRIPVQSRPLELL